MEAVTELLWRWPDPRASSGVETGMSGNFLSCSKGVKDPLEVPEVRCDYLETPQRKWASSRLEGRTSWIFSSCGRCSRLMAGTSGTRSGGLRKGQSPCELLGGFSGFLSRRCWGLRPCVESVSEPENFTEEKPAWGQQIRSAQVQLNSQHGLGKRLPLSLSLPF